MIPTGAVISMAVLFREVKRHRAMVRSMEEQQAASMATGQMNQLQEAASRKQNLQRMRDQTKTQLALSMGVSPVMMGDSSEAYVAQSAAAQQPGSMGVSLFSGKKTPEMGLGMV